MTDVRTCTICGETKPLETGFYTSKLGRGGYANRCTTCANKRPPTASRLVRNRARSRAYAKLAELHPEEFAELLEEQTVVAQAEHEQLAAKARAKGNPDSGVARIKPGPKRRTESGAVDRVDVARCPSCHTHHDAAHQCPTCGDETPEQPQQHSLAGRPVQPWQIREWAFVQGVDCPPRGPVPRRVVEAFARAHQMMPNRAGAR